jgi:hypothetical protein
MNLEVWIRGTQLSKRGKAGAALVVTLSGKAGPAPILSTLFQNSGTQGGWQQGPDPIAVAKSMRRAVETLVPTVCGGGAFAYVGQGGTAFGVKGFSGVIGEIDSQSGGSLGTLKEAGVGGVGGGFIHSSSGLSGLGYLELGELPGLADFGFVGGNGWAGGYAEGNVNGVEVGGGGYAKVTSVAACGGW